MPVRISWARVAPPPSDTGQVMQVDHSDPQFGGDGVSFEGPTSFDTGLVMQGNHSDPQFGGDGPTSSDTDTIVAHSRSCHANSLVRV